MKKKLQIGLISGPLIYLYYFTENEEEITNRTYIRSTSLFILFILQRMKKKLQIGLISGPLIYNIYFTENEEEITNRPYIGSTGGRKTHCSRWTFGW